MRWRMITLGASIKRDCRSCGNIPLGPPACLIRHCSDRLPGPRPWRLYLGRKSFYSYRIGRRPDRKSTRLNSSHVAISYAVFCLKKEKGLGGRLYKLVVASEN